MRKREHTDLEIQRRYRCDLERLFSVRSENDRLFYREAKVSWPAVNQIQFVWGESAGLDSRFVNVFGESDVVWVLPIVVVVSGELAIDILLVDSYSDEPIRDEMPELVGIYNREVAALMSARKGAGLSASEEAAHAARLEEVWALLSDQEKFTIEGQ